MIQPPLPPPLPGRRKSGFITDQPAQARALASRARVKPILTVGDPLPGQESNADPEQRVWSPIPDGLGATSQEGSLVLFANHEITSGGVDGKFPYSRVSRLVLDPSTLEITSGSYAVTGKAAGFLLQRLCSATFIGQDQGFGNGWFFTGEESTTGGAEESRPPSRRTAARLSSCRGWGASRTRTTSAVVELENEKFTGNVCSEPAGSCWESSGIIDASEWLGEGSWLFDVQAHTLPFSYLDGQTKVDVSSESGQLLYLRVTGS